MQTRIVVTGGPSAGKTTLLRFLATRYGSRIGISPEAASILFTQGHPRPNTYEERLRLQLAIYAMQVELELKCNPEVPVFCDRGSLDGSAYFPGSVKEFCFAMGSTLERELKRYTAVIHLQAAEAGYGYTNTQLRTESPAQAAELDRCLGEHWGAHPNYIFVPNQRTFSEKLGLALSQIETYLPEPAVSSLKLDEALDALRM